MKSISFLRNPSSLIYSFLGIFITFVLLLYGTMKLEEKISLRMMEITTSDVISIINNNALVIEKLLNSTSSDDYVQAVKADFSLYKEIEDNLSLLLTTNIKYAYLLYKDERGIFRFLVDGTSLKEKKALVDQKFDIDNPIWLDVFKTKKPIIFTNKYLEELSTTYLTPILKNDEVKLVLVVDFSIEKLENINEILDLLKLVLILIILIVLIFLVLLLIQSYKYIAIRKTAYIDKLTGVYNRNYLQEFGSFINLKDYILATLDIDHFKTVNDSYGHIAGDKILKELAAIISSSTRTKEDIVIRYGGEEFIILTKVKSEDSVSALNVIERILLNIQEHKFYYKAENYINITASIGINLYPYKSDNFSEAFKLADISLYNAKNKGRNNIQIYDDLQFDKDHTNISINDINEALDEDRIICFYQGIIDNNTGKTHYYEALLRIIDKEGKIVTPNSILPIIEGTFLLRNITKSILNNCYKKLLEKEDIKLTINLRKKDLLDKSIIKILENYAKKQDISNRLAIEIVQSSELISNKEVKINLNLLKSLGYKIFIDDFGTAYTDFIHLTQIKTDYIKIDGKIIKRILEDKVIHSLVKTIVSFAKDADIKVVAEHVDSKEIYDEIKNLGIDYSQGYYFSSPKEII
ncbi:diguanylate cyclase/phosphodiesterase [Arcobacter acticola]|uniref:Diguanylate cyclase/phosphodiesterase n=1 Tax=Arcobacter acticola TaxID=1849015 RepID=A0A6M8EFQ0_9BACT|nr:EAL domain-containing protein [Arcobacter acticola]QKE28802.1 diguanylate cyclase/phosphodiesterase [Arcobacter acticola]